MNQHSLSLVRNVAAKGDKGVLYSRARVSVAHARCSVCVRCAVVYADRFVRAFSRALAGMAVRALVNFRMCASDSSGARTCRFRYHHVYSARVLECVITCIHAHLM